MLKKWILWRSIQIIIDFLLIYLAFLIAYGLRVGWIISNDFPLEPFALISFLCALLWSGFLFLTKYYRLPIRSGKRIWFDAILALIGGIIAVSALIVIYFFQQELFFSRLINFYVVLLGTSLLFTSQFIFRTIIAQHKKQDKNIYRTLIVGANRTTEQLIKAIESNPYTPYKVIGVIDPYGLEKKIKGHQILGKLNKLETICDREKITALIQCDAFEHTLNLISLCEEKDIQFQFDPALRGIYEKNLRIREIAGQTMISFVKRDFNNKNKEFAYKWGDRLLRQVFDID